MQNNIKQINSGVVLANAVELVANTITEIMGNDISSSLDEVTIRPDAIMGLTASIFNNKFLENNNVKS